MKEMKLIFEIHTIPDSFELEDGILNSLNDDGPKSDVEIALANELEAIMRYRENRVIVRLKEWF